MIAQASSGLSLQHSTCMLSGLRRATCSTSAAVLRPPRCVRANSQAASDLPDVQRLAELSQIEVTAQEAEEWGPKIAEIVDWFGQLKNVNTEGVEPALRATTAEESNMLRPDTVKEFEQRESLMNEVPEMEGPYVRVPKVM